MITFYSMRFVYKTRIRDILGMKPISTGIAKGRRKGVVFAIIIIITPSRRPRTKNECNSTRRRRRACRVIIQSIAGKVYNNEQKISPAPTRRHPPLATCTRTHVPLRGCGNSRVAITLSSLKAYLCYGTKCPHTSWVLRRTHTVIRIMIIWPRALNVTSRA